MSYLQHFGLKNPPFHKGSSELWNSETLSELELKVHRLLITIKPHCFCKLAEIYFVVYMFKYIFPVCQS